MFIVNANPKADKLNACLTAQHDCTDIMALCGLSVIQTNLSEKKLMESEEITQDIFGIVNLKCRVLINQTFEQPYRVIRSENFPNAETNLMLDIFCDVFNRDAYGHCGYVSARNAWYEQFQLARAITINFAQCNLDSDFKEEASRNGERIAISLIKFMLRVLPEGAHIITKNCSEYFGDRSDYLNNKYPFEY